MREKGGTPNCSGANIPRCENRRLLRVALDQMAGVDMEERRQFWPKDPEFFVKLEQHMLLEEQREAEGDRKFEEGAERMAKIEEDLQPLKKMYYAVVGSGSVMVLLLGTLLFIYGEDKERLMRMQEVLYKQGTAIEVLIKAHETLENRADRTMGQLDRMEDRLDKLRVPQP